MDDMKLVLDAARFAAEHHRLQRRKGDGVGELNLKTPYINHPLTVAQEIAVTGGMTDANVIAAAILHDTVEDTDDKSLEKMERKRLQVEHAPHLSRGAAHVKLADKISNVRDLLDDTPPSWTLERIREYFDWAKSVIDPLRGTNPALEAAFDALYAKRP